MVIKGPLHYTQGSLPVNTYKVKIILYDVIALKRHSIIGK